MDVVAGAGGGIARTTHAAFSKIGESPYSAARSFTSVEGNSPPAPGAVAFHQRTKRTPSVCQI
ncbi:MAG: hypothetical protein L3K08_03175, partial [Thermoplasmata archaeon]|nr:hypothetical protein [Thermoplasmata archaeon]